MKLHTRNEKGLTLIETMIAMVVLAILLIGIGVGNAVLQQTGDAAFQRTRAIQDANQVMELIRRTAAVGNFPGNVTGAYPNAGTVAGYTSLPSEVITVAYTDTNADGNATNDNPLDVTVTVSWLENGRRTVNTSLRALVTQR
jgi:prepilin-type N-terminal cleavage/methylation domain-containing protein